MQLSDAEVREILIRRKIEKKRRQKRRRRIVLLVLLIIIAVIFILLRINGHRSSSGSSDQPEESLPAYTGEIRGTVFIDPGHGGMDSGSDDDNGRYEKDDTLRIALAVRDCLESLGFKVEMSRTEDKQVDRTLRGEMANKAGAQLFVSIHRNKAATNGYGVEGFIPKENDSESRMLGENIMHALGRAGFKERTIRAGTLYDPSDDYEENAATTMPSVLIEVGFLSSPGDNALLDSNLMRNARAIASGIDLTFMSLHEPDKVAAYTEMLSEIDAIREQIPGVLILSADAMKSAVESFPSVGADGTESGTGIDPEA